MVDSSPAHYSFLSVNKGLQLQMERFSSDPEWPVHEQVMILGFQASLSGQIWQIQRLDATKILAIQPEKDYMNFFELCCGMGALSMGVRDLGFTPCAAIDISELATKVYASNHAAPVVHDNLLDPSALASLFEKTGRRRCGLVAGFPCPPFSTRGDQKGFLDSRSQVFVGCLDVAYLFGATFVVLECTPVTGKWKETVDLLGSFANAMSFCYETGILNLHRAWPCHRSRWWAMLLPKQVRPFLLPVRDLPWIEEYQMVKDIMPVTTWPTEHERALTWDSYERSVYAELIQFDDVLLSMTGKSPTILHSCGHVPYPCPCGCRMQGLSRQRLIKDGLSLIAMRCGGDETTAFRHLHPLEAAHLCGVPADVNFPCCDLRAALPLIGQLASPIHSRWIFLQLRSSLGQANLIVIPDDRPHLEHLQDFLRKLLLLRKVHWPDADSCMIRSIELEEQDTVMAIQVPAFAKVGQLLAAQRQLLGWGQRIELLRDGRLAGEREFLHSGRYSLVTTQPRALRPLDAGSFHVSIQTTDMLHTGQFPSGSLIADVMTSFGLCSFDVRPFANSFLSQGDRLWHDFVGTLRGAGGPGLLGIDVNSVMHEAQILTCDSDDSLALLPVDLVAEAMLKPKVIMGYQIKLLIEQCLQNRNGAPLKFGILMCEDEHWSLFVHRVLDESSIHFDSLPGRHSATAQLLAKVFADFFGHRPVLYPSQSLLLQHDDDLCGVHALINLGAELGKWETFTYDEAVAWMDALRPHDCPRGGGATDYASAHSTLIELLPTKGVPPEKAAERASLAIKRLGLNPVLRALAADNQWQALKSLGSNNERPFMWISHDELKHHISNKAQQKFGASHGKRRQFRPKDDKSKIPLQLPIDQLFIPEGAFVDSGKNPLRQISIEKVKADASGVAVASVEQAMRFLQDGVSISPDHLALLTSSEIPQPTPGHLTVENITWPALFQNEPLLVRGSMLQLGDLHVALKKGPVPSSCAVTTELLRLQVYKDQWPKDWQAFIKGPLPQLVSHFSQLQVCNSAGCGTLCTRFHPAVEESCELVLLDCFSWRWFSDDGTIVSAPKSCSFSVMVRTPHSAVDGILSISGQDGFYPEVREKDGTPSKFAIIWLKKDYQESLHTLQVQPLALHLIRLHQRFGLRCLRKNEIELRKLLFPEEPYISCEVKFIYQLGPYGFGFTKAQVQESLRPLSWKAIVLKPTKGSPHGRYWLVGAEATPPCAIFQCGDLQITIGKVKDATPPKSNSNIVASLQTIQRIQGQALPTHSATPDPWLQHDPWSKFKPSTQTASASSTGPTRAEQIEERILAQIQTQLDARLPGDTQDADMNEDHESRLERIEFNMAELQQQNQKFSTWFQEAGEKMTIMESTMAQHTANMDTLSHTVHQQGASMANIQHTMGTMEGNIRADFKQAMEHMESLLAKKARCE